MDYSEREDVTVSHLWALKIMEGFVDYWNKLWFLMKWAAIAVSRRGVT